MKKVFAIVSLFLGTALSPTTAFANEVTTEYHADPIVVTADIDRWESDPIFQLPIAAPTTLVVRRVDLTKSFDSYAEALTELRQLFSSIEFEASPEQIATLEAARQRATEKLAVLRQYEMDYVQERLLFESDPESYVGNVVPDHQKVAKN